MRLPLSPLPHKWWGRLDSNQQFPGFPVQFVNCCVGLGRGWRTRTANFFLVRETRSQLRQSSISPYYKYYIRIYVRSQMVSHPRFELGKSRTLIWRVCQFRQWDKRWIERNWTFVIRATTWCSSIELLPTYWRPRIIHHGIAIYNHKQFYILLYKLYEYYPLH